MLSDLKVFPTGQLKIVHLLLDIRFLHACDRLLAEGEARNDILFCEDHPILVKQLGPEYEILPRFRGIVRTSPETKKTLPSFVTISCPCRFFIAEPFVARPHRHAEEVR